MKRKAIIIGAGISGVVIARKLAEQNFKVEIYEKRNHIAGNMYDYKKDGILIHKYGPHIFHTSKPKVIEFISQYWELNNFRNVVEGYVNNKLVPIPFNFKSIDECFGNESEEIKTKLLSYYPNNESIAILELLKNNDPLINKLAHFVYDNLFLNYTTKMWNLKPNEIDSSVTARIPIILSYKNTYFNDVYEGLPLGGYTKAIERMIDHPNINLFLEKDINKDLVINNEKIYLHNDNEIVIYTGPLDKLFNNKFGSLDYRSLFFEFEVINKTQYQKTAVVNFPAHPTMTRITEYKNMTLENIKDKTIISKEFPGTYDENNSKWNEPYYPLATEEARKKYKKYLIEAKKIKNLYLCGRMATYQYLNMDEAINNALNIAEEILNNE